MLSRVVAFLCQLLHFEASDEALSLLLLTENDNILFILLRFLLTLVLRFLTEAFLLITHYLVFVNYTFDPKEKFDTRLRSLLLKI